MSWDVKHDGESSVVVNMSLGSLLGGCGVSSGTAELALWVYLLCWSACAQNLRRAEGSGVRVGTAIVLW